MNQPRCVVLVEGNSDRVALHTLAQCLGRDLDAEGVDVVAMGGITNTRAFATRYGPNGLDLVVAGLYDIGEQAVLRRGLVAAGFGDPLEPHALERLGFYACSGDLEDELLRALGTEAVEAVIAAAGEAQSLRLLANMPAQRGWPRRAVLRRFLGSRSGRKARYADLFVRALAPGQLPEPLAALLAHVERHPAGATDGEAPGIQRG
ncbi:MAG: TOPRIM nucleotidyl transferase/hydrolase domain-containing protein [Ornithinibacter sp.]